MPRRVMPRRVPFRRRGPVRTTPAAGRAAVRHPVPRRQPGGAPARHRPSLRRTLRRRRQRPGARRRRRPAAGGGRRPHRLPGGDARPHAGEGRCAPHRGGVPVRGGRVPDDRPAHEAPARRRLRRRGDPGRGRPPASRRHPCPGPSTWRSPRRGWPPESPAARLCWPSSPWSSGCWRPSPPGSGRPRRRPRRTAWRSETRSTPSGRTGSSRCRRPVRSPHVRSRRSRPGSMSGALIEP